MMQRRIAAAVSMLLGSVGAVLADQAACEKTVRALLAPSGENQPKAASNRFGTVTTTIDGKTQKGFSLQTREGSVYYDGNKNPVSLSFSSGETFWSPDKGKSWKLVNPNSKAVMDAAAAGLRSQAEKAQNITCKHRVDYEGRTVHHYSADYRLYNTGDQVHAEYWVDPDSGFVWRDLTHAKGAAEVVTDVRATPAPEMSLPAKPN